MKTTNRFDEALLFAARLHREQERKHSGVPYVAHLMAVSALVMEDGGDEHEAIAALLHDALEDQGDRYAGGRSALREDILGRFGARVLEIVDACTDDELFPKGHAATPELEREAWLARKRAYLEHLRGTADAGIRRVACADKLHNTCSMLADYARTGNELWGRFRTGRADDQIWYAAELARIFNGGSILERRFRRAAGELAGVAGPS